MCHAQLAKRYYNAHALVDLSVSATLDQTVDNGSAQKVEDVCIIISMPTVVEKGALTIRAILKPQLVWMSVL